jgi:transposase-like protein
MATTRRRHTAEFKREAVRLAQQHEMSRVQMAQDLHIDHQDSGVNLL